MVDAGDGIEQYKGKTVDDTACQFPAVKIRKYPPQAKKKHKDADSATYNMGRYLTDYLNYPLNWDTVTDFSQHSRVREMPVFPAAGAIQMIDGTVVIKLS